MGASAASLRKYNSIIDDMTKIIGAVKSFIFSLLYFNENKARLLTNKKHDIILNITKNGTE